MVSNLEGRRDAPKNSREVLSCKFLRELKVLLANPLFSTEKKLHMPVINHLSRTSPLPHQTDNKKQYFKELHSVLSVCVSQMLKSSGRTLLQPYATVYCLILQLVKQTAKSEYMLRQFLPLVCAATWIEDSDLLSSSSAYIRLAVRYHPRTAGETVTKPILNAISKNKSRELMKLLFYIQSYNPNAFQSYSSGQLLLSVFSQPNTPLPIQTDCLNLAHRVLDDLPLTEAATKICFGPSLSDCIETLLVGGSEQTGLLLSSLLIKLAHRNLADAMKGHANAQLPQRLQITWPGCLEAALSLLVALAHEKNRRKHKRSAEVASNFSCSSMSGCLDAIAGYLKKAERIKDVIACLVSLQDIAPITDPGILEKYATTIEEACSRVGISKELLLHNSWTKSAANSSPYGRIVSHSDFQKWLEKKVTMLGCKVTDSPFVEKMLLNNKSADGSSISLSVQSNCSVNNQVEEFSGCRETSEQDIEQREVSGFFQTQSNDVRNFHQEYRSVQLLNTNNGESEVSSGGDTPPSSASYDLPPESPYSSSDLVKESITKNQLPVCAPSNDSKVMPSRVYFPSRALHPGFHSERRTKITARKTEHREEDSWGSVSTAVKTHPMTQGEFKHSNPIPPAKSAPQLYPIDQVDPIQRFHDRYYSRLTGYMAFLLDRLPLPAAVSIERPISYKGKIDFETDLIWLDGQTRQTYVKSPLASQNTVSSSVRSKGSTSWSGINTPALTLYFVCSKPGPRCLYPGGSMRTCFQLLTRYPVLWMQILILASQAKYGKALPVSHPSMKTLRLLWADIMGDVLSPTHSQHSEVQRIRSYNERSSRPSRLISSRPVSACDTLGQRTVNFEDSQQNRLSRSSRSPVWHSFRNRSRRKLNKVSSFFLLATRAYPTVEECDNLVKELDAAHFFEYFELHRGKTEERTQSDTPVFGRWRCFLCDGLPGLYDTLELLGSNNRSNAVSTGLDYRPQTDSVLEAWSPRLTGRLQCRHIKTIPKALAWMSRWQTRQFILRDGIIECRKCRSGRKKYSEILAYDFPNETTTGAAAQQTRLKKKRTKGMQNGQWDCISVAELRYVHGIRSRQTGILVQLELRTFEDGVWMIRPAHRIVDDSQQARQRDFAAASPYSFIPVNNDLTLWLRSLQVAMVRSRQLQNENSELPVFTQI
ncbi:unnamed protein product [Calicophoron daubneyi]|uniref:Uncharacterized protein n=1 Tax=Calicophoron daubneyi TaxID=300641 RepID=A0AAV2TMJ7_CALDB